MGRFLSMVLAGCLCLMGCTASGRMSGDPTAVMLGANIGGMAGAVIGSASSRSYHGELMGSLIGTVAGAVIANAATTPQQEVKVESDTEWNDGYSRTSHRRRRASDFDLEVRNLRFIDDNRNHIIESGEHAKIIFEVVNRGRTSAFHVTPVVMEKAGIKRLYISSSVTLECIPAGDGIRYTANISAGKMPKKGEAVFHITVMDDDGNSIPVREFVIPIKR